MTKPAFTPVSASRRLMREARSAALATLDAGTGMPFATLVTVAGAADGAPLLLLSDLAAHTRNLKADPQAWRPFLDRHPEAEGYAGFRDFAFYRMAVETGHLVAGFGRIVDLKAADLLLDLAEAGEIVGAETEILEHLNADHADALALYATRLAGAPDGAWRAIGSDPEGLDLALDTPAGTLVRRIAYPEPIRHTGPLRAVLKKLADTARSG